MKSTLIKFGIYMAGLLVLGAVIYIFAFLRPNANRIESLHLDIAAAHIELEAARGRDNIHPELLMDVERLTGEVSNQESDWERSRNVWDNYFAQHLPAIFDEADIRQRIDGIVRPHSESLNMYFPYSQPRSVMSYNEDNPHGLPEGIWLTPIEVSFTASYGSLITILDSLAHIGIDNRIVEYSLHREGDGWNVSLQLDILTQTPHPYRYNRDYSVRDGA